MNTPALHIALNVQDLATAVSFYGGLFGLAPAKHYPDYAKFEMVDPPLVLSLNPAGPGTGPARLSHLGIRVDSEQALDALEQRVRAAGLSLTVEGETTCCYARARKLWVRDPDGNDWELYRFLADTQEKNDGAATDCCSGGGCA